ncbi:hypothetical protein JCM8097_009455 [Rhodosporidiobolus ruineniae]
MGRKVIVTIHRNDLRISDNALYSYAHDQDHDDVTHVLPVFVFDERYLELSGLPGYQRQGLEARTRLCKFWRTSAFRAKFLTEGVYDLRRSLRQRGSDLLIRFGKMEDIAADIAKALVAQGDEIREVLLQEEFYSEEKGIERRMRRKLEEFGVKLTVFDQVPLLHPDDLPFSMDKLPDVFTPFRKRVEALPHLGRAPLPIPPSFKPFPRSPPSTPYPGYALDAHDLDYVLPYLLKPLEDTFQVHALDTTKTAFPYAGGETSALERVEWYFRSEAEMPPVQRYKETRNGLLGHAYSTKLSPFLCLGMISARTVVAAIDAFEREYGQTQSAYWLRFELLWRDYFLFCARKYGTKLFTLGGFEEVTDPKQAAPKLEDGWWKVWDREAARAKKLEEEQPAVRWMRGETGVPFIDANIAELRESGFMSNRGRQNVASFLTKDLQIDWRVGAEFFESHLIDYEPSNNWGNWQYVGGVGNDPRASRQFNPVKQGNDYDPYGDYVRTWLPQLSGVPTSKIQCPWTLPAADFARFIPSGKYPTTPVIEQVSWKPHYTKKGPSKHGVTNKGESRIVLRGGKSRSAGPNAAAGGAGGGGGGGSGKWMHAGTQTASAEEAYRDGGAPPKANGYANGNGRAPNGRARRGTGGKENDSASASSADA